MYVNVILKVIFVKYLKYIMNIKVFLGFNIKLLIRVYLEYANTEIGRVIGR